MQNTAHKQEVENGDVSFALVDSRSNPAWHSFANKVFDSDSGDVSISEIMAGAKLSNWNVRLENSFLLSSVNFSSFVFNGIIRTSSLDGAIS